MAKEYTVEILNHGRRVYDFMRWQRLSLAISLLLLAASIAIISTRGFNWGLDFTGGTIIEVNLKKSINIETIRNTLDKGGIIAPIIQYFGSSHDLIIRIPANLDTTSQALGNKIITIINTEIDTEAIISRIEFVGPAVGQELAQAGTLALLVALICILIYIALRFEWRLALGAVIALAHDIFITAGILALLNIEIDLTMIASLMSVIGYSLNDSIVVSDRIRENFRKLQLGNAYEIVNISLTQTLGRTMITSGTTLLVLLMLYIFGGQMLAGFSLTMLIGISIGTVSSIYVASALALKLGMQREHMLQHKIEKEGADQPSILP